MDMKGLRVEGQQLGAAQIETLAHPGECRQFGHATKFFHSFNTQNTHEDLGFGGPIPATVGTCDTKVTTFTRISTVYRGRGIPLGGSTDTRDGTKSAPTAYSLL